MDYQPNPTTTWRESTTSDVVNVLPCIMAKTWDTNISVGVKYIAQNSSYYFFANSTYDHNFFTFAYVNQRVTIRCICKHINCKHLPSIISPINCCNQLVVNDMYAGSACLFLGKRQSVPTVCNLSIPGHNRFKKTVHTWQDLQWTSKLCADTEGHQKQSQSNFQ